MKKIKTTLLITICALVLILGCKKNNNSNPSPPPPAQTYNHDFHCKANGVLFESDAMIGNHNSSIFQILGPGITNTQTTYSETNIMFVGVLPVKGTYKIGEENVGDAYGTYSYGTLSALISYGTDATHTGTVVITNYDSTAHKISGTFNFSLVQVSPTQDSTKTVSITEGQFTDLTW